MGHCVTALIANQNISAYLRENHSLAAVDLGKGWHLVPLDDDDLDNLGLDFSTVLDGFNYLSPSLRDFMIELSGLGALAYVETEYFGGEGGQAAAAFKEGRLLATPSAEERAINRALRSIGIFAPEGLDEFDHIGLSRHRHTSDWKEAASEAKA
ncbi:hypothetical protein OJ996_20325 [Luteolibacter sp. GHJ8]|uniref:Uncharacterized protein n=1 Tax=Luteolibacter rhizosphaerae TaxID=2989719 RepID=A0ABT3G8W6_9BACT|nr:hypothetical protein [Luteolibacter rhizosphaerae]MCW1915946.1 hypothetical protein [Luteolibacter rhizosphaerae]